MPGIELIRLLLFRGKVDIATIWQCLEDVEHSRLLLDGVLTYGHGPNVGEARVCRLTGRHPFAWVVAALVGDVALIHADALAKDHGLDRE
jgi:hypothetical protein